MFWSATGRVRKSNKNDMIVCFSLKSPFFLVRYINEALQQQYGVVDYP